MHIIIPLFSILFAAVQFAFYILGILCMIKFLSGRR